MASRSCKEESNGIQAAFWAALKNPEHRMKHWLQLVAIPNAPSSSSNSELQSMKKRIADLEKARSRSPRSNSQKQNALAGAPAMLALPSPSAPALRVPKGGKGKNNKKKGKGNGKSGSSSSQSSGDKNFDFILYRVPVEFRSNFHERFQKREICCAFQKNSCRSANTCRFAHICVDCGGPKPYDECMCLTNKIN